MMMAEFHEAFEALKTSALKILFHVGKTDLVEEFSTNLQSFFQQMTPYIIQTNNELLQQISEYLTAIQTALLNEDYVRLADIVMFETQIMVSGLKK